MSEASVRSRSVRRSVTVPVVSPGGGFDRSASLRSDVIGDDLGPFVDLTLFEMSQPVFRPHPHAGFSAVTYMLESSAGTFRNRWTAGPDELIGPGTIHWTRAGSGMMHEEVPTVPGVSCLGVQMFVKLPAERELDPPQAFHLDADQVRELTPEPGARVRILAGQLAETPSMLGLPDELTYLDVHLEAGARVTIPTPAAWRAFVFVLSGAVGVGGVPIAGPAAATFEADGDVVDLGAVTSSNLLFCSGPPIGTYVSRGSFIMSSHERLEAAARRFAAGEMGHLSPSF
jgi:redox-sensitive bicupin YhaK (pirin superfamily)